VQPEVLEGKQEENVVETTHQANEEQATLWNGPGGRGWVEAQLVLDQVLRPFEDLLVKAVGDRPRGCVLDVGCGTGSTTLAISRLLGAKGRCSGIDISEPMLEAARARAERESTPVRFIRADAQIYAFEPASFDVIVSRFGVMFFDDPVRAFTNLRRAARDEAELLCVAWRTAAENPFMTTAERAAAPFVPDNPARQLDAPGQFAFADQRKVYRILTDSGWVAIDIRPVDVDCTFPEKELVRYLTLVGPIGRMLQEADDRTRRRVIETVRPAFDPYVHGPEVRFTAASWLIYARAPSA
jgi:SAM-dependent methyltransferase